MQTLFTIGCTRKTLKHFITLLRTAEVDAVVDVRLRNTSQLAGFSKRDDLAFLLGNCYGITYEHRLDLSPSKEILDAYRVDGDWAAYELRFGELMAQRQALHVGRAILARYRRPCLLCAEPEPGHCHRRLVAELWAEHIPDLAVRHL